MSKSGNYRLCGTQRHSLHRDHIKPKWAGGADDESNIQYICANCHEDKTRQEMQSSDWRGNESRTERLRRMTSRDAEVLRLTSMSTEEFQRRYGRKGTA